MDKRLRFTLKKEERLSGEKRIENLFANGRSFIAYPLRVVYVHNEFRETGSPVSIFVSVPKKRIKSAVKRNRIKRLIRETYRLNKYFLSDQLSSGLKVNIALVYVKNDLSDFITIEKAVLKTLKEIAKDLKNKREQ